ncbi:MAG: helix-turn-helix transcriptional regulator [Salinivirgaceae bacterium]|nr:helix-turn-helix transcriptional regulator [Salinivirgaceae bacterium]
MNIPYLPFRPPHMALQHFKENKTEESYDSICYHEKILDGFSIWNSYYGIKNKTNFDIDFDIDFLGFLFAFKNNFHFNVPHLNNNLLEGQYNLVYKPSSLPFNVSFEETGIYSLLYLKIPLIYITKWKNPFPIFSDFISNLKSETVTTISDNHLHTTTEMEIIVQDCLNCHFEGTLREIYLEAKVRELSALCFNQIIQNSMRSKKNILTPQDVFKIQAARQFLLTHIDTDFSLRKIALKVGTNEFKLKQGFKQLYGLPVFNYIREERMKKANELLKLTDTPISEIALIIGYKNLSNFTAAFKKRFDYPPSIVREREKRKKKK